MSLGQSTKKIIAFASICALSIMCAFDLAPQDDYVYLSSTQKVKNRRVKEDPVYLVFDSEPREEQIVIHTIETCPVPEWETLGQWTVMAHNSEVQLDRIPFEALRGPTANPFDLTDSYKVILSTDKEMKKITKESEVSTRGKRQFIARINTALAADVKYYITLLGKDIEPSYHNQAHVRILSYDHPSLNDSVLGRFKKANTSMKRKDSDIRFKKVTLDLKLNSTPQEYPDRECRKKYFDALYSRYIEGWGEDAS